MEILNITENKDGSSTLECDCTNKEIEMLASIGLNKVLKDYIKELKKEKKDGNN